MSIEQEIEKARKWVEISKATLEQVIEEGQSDEIIEYQRNELRFYEDELKRLQEQLKNGGYICYPPFLFERHQRLL